jgi:hypothetical protein
VATILLCGVDLFFRGKLEALLPGHRLVTIDHTDVPIIGYTNHTDTAGLRAAHAAGFDQVLAKSALVERAADIVAELLPG